MISIMARQNARIGNNGGVWRIMANIVLVSGGGGVGGGVVVTAAA